VILGEFKNGFPCVTLSLLGVDGRPVPVEFIVDTAFDGDVKLPAEIVRRLAAAETGPGMRMLADGTLADCPIYNATLFWNGEARLVEVLALPGNALLGTSPLLGAHLDVEMDEGGEVIIELPG
jgi:predicted aspartyl protease